MLHLHNADDTAAQVMPGVLICAAEWQRCALREQNHACQCQHALFGHCTVQKRARLNLHDLHDFFVSKAMLSTEPSLWLEH